MNKARQQLYVDFGKCIAAGTELWTNACEKTSQRNRNAFSDLSESFTSLIQAAGSSPDLMKASAEFSGAWVRCGEYWTATYRDAEAYMTEFYKIAQESSAELQSRLQGSLKDLHEGPASLYTSVQDLVRTVSPNLEKFWSPMWQKRAARSTETS